jgi:2-hydroxy-3-oxopropionate reductase
MSRNIAKAGFDLTVWNRSAEKAAPLAKDGITVAGSAGDAVAGADLVISMVSDGSILDALLADTQVQSALTPDTIWIDMSSTKPAEARAAATQLKAIGVSFLDAPVSGGSQGAEDGTLAIMVGGAQATFERAVPVLNSMGRPTLVGPNGAGQLAKLANQAIVGVTIAAVAEATLLLEQGGADPTAVRAALKGGFADSTILQQHGERMTERNFVPGGLSHLQLKDLDNVLKEADGLTLPLVQSVRDRFARYVTDLDGATRDHAGLFEELLDLNGKA